MVGVSPIAPHRQYDGRIAYVKRPWSEFLVSGVEIFEVFCPALQILRIIVVSQLPRLADTPHCSCVSVAPPYSNSTL